MDAEDRVKARLAGMMALVYSVQGAFWPVLSIHLVDLGISERGRGWIFGTMAMASFAIPLGAGQLVDRLMPTQRFLSLGFGAGTVLLAVMGLFPGRFGPVFLVPCAINAALLRHPALPVPAVGSQEARASPADEPGATAPAGRRGSRRPLIGGRSDVVGFALGGLLGQLLGAAPALPGGLGLGRRLLDDKLVERVGRLFEL